jgi:RND family efflux transporter MFP subunit
MRSPETHQPRAVRGRVARLVLHVLLPVLVLAAGGALAVRLVETAPKAERKPPVRMARLVDVEEIKFGPQTTVVSAMGTVTPARQIDLKPQVDGRITEVADEFAPGGRFRAGDVILRLDPKDYELMVRQRTGDLAQARSDLQIELGQQEVAKREFELLGETIHKGDESLVLRKPQLATARAKVEIAEASLDQAKLDLERTTVTAPFNAMIGERDVDLGVQVGTSTTLATLFGTDAYWIEVAVPVDELKWIEMSGTTPARVYDEAAWGPGVFRQGEVIRMMGDLEQEGRMARLLVEVEDPLSLEPENSGKPTLIVGAYLRVEIDGAKLESVAAIDRRYIRDGSKVWIMNADNALEIRPVEIAYYAPDHVLVSGGVAEGERLVVSDLPAPVEGMPLRTADDHSGPPTSPQAPAPAEGAS